MSIKHFIFHFLTVMHYMGATYYNAYSVVIPNSERFRNFHAFGGLAKYLTLWNMKKWGNIQIKGGKFSVIKMLRFLVHLIGALQFSFSIYYDWNHVIVPPEIRSIDFSYAKKLVFLTFWNATIQTVYFWLCVWNDLFGSNEINPKPKPAVRAFKDTLFCSIAFPLSAFVAITFWGIYAIDRELVLPRALDEYFPTWLNHIMHTNILIFTLIELVSSFRVYPSRKTGILYLTSLLLVYMSWILFIFAKSGQWVYPVLEVLNWPQRFLFFLGMLFCAFSFYISGEKLNSIVWKTELKNVFETDVRKSKKC